MTDKYLDKYYEITKGKKISKKYSSPELQGAAIKRCSVLKSVDLEYSNQTKSIPKK